MMRISNACVRHSVNAARPSSTGETLNPLSSVRMLCTIRRLISSSSARSTLYAPVCSMLVPDYLFITRFLGRPYIDGRTFFCWIFVAGKIVRTMAKFWYGKGIRPTFPAIRVRHERNSAISVLQASLAFFLAPCGDHQRPARGVSADGHDFSGIRSGRARAGGGFLKRRHGSSSGMPAHRRRYLDPPDAAKMEITAKPGPVDTIGLRWSC